MATLRTKMEQLCALDRLLVSIAAHADSSTAQDEFENEQVLPHYNKQDTFDLQTAIEEVEEILKAGNAVLKTLKKDTLESENKSKIDLCAEIIYDHGEDEKEEGEVEDEKDDCKKRKKKN